MIHTSFHSGQGVDWVVAVIIIKMLVPLNISIHLIVVGTPLTSFSFSSILIGLTIYPVDLRGMGFVGVWNLNILVVVS